MSKFSLAYLGPAAERGPALVAMLKRHPEARFVEKDERLFEVVSAEDFAQSVREAALWHAERLND